jgi:DNA-binding winged helix-turn-helix (wHTH) protein/Tol biopolymer transport system component
MSTIVLRFGLFEMQTATRQLFKQGRRVRLQEQPRRVLEALLEEPGRLVTRQELRQRLWPGDVHVDFELGLTGAIKRLRLALDDSADNPRFIETVPKSGFRFIAPVETVTESPTARAVPRLRGVSRATSLWIAVSLVAATVTGAYWRPMTPRPRVTRVVKLSDSGCAWPQESLLSDGARVYYTEFVVGTGFRLRQILLNGNEDTVADGLPRGSLVRALSPDHTTFLAISRYDAESGAPSPLWAVPVVGGPPRRLGSVRSNDFAWSPDGTALAFARDRQLVVSSPVGGAEHPLAVVPGHVVSPRWSPDGRRLRFTVLGAEGELSLWEVGADGGSLHPLDFGWPGARQEGFGEWTVDGRYYVFVSRREGTSDLWALEEEGTDFWHRRRTEPVQLTAGPVSYFRPLPSQDGKQVFALGTEPGAELVRYDKARREFVPFLGGRPAEYLEFSRDGRWVAYVQYPQGTLWRARADGREAVQLTNPPLRAFLPRWSPDGRRILFAGKVTGTPPRVFSIPPEGGNPEPLIGGPEGQADPSWCAGGECIVYSRDRDDESRDVALYRFDLRRGRSERIPGTDGLHAPIWSPNGRYLAARAATSGRLFLVDPGSGRSVAVSKRRGDYAAWSPDSLHLYYNSVVREHVAIFRARVPDGAEEEVTELPFKPAGSYGIWSGLAPDGSPLVLRDRGRTDVYALSLVRPPAP